MSEALHALPPVAPAPSIKQETVSPCMENIAIGGSSVILFDDTSQSNSLDKILKWVTVTRLWDAYEMLMTRLWDAYETRTRYLWYLTIDLFTVLLRLTNSKKWMTKYFYTNSVNFRPIYRQFHWFVLVLQIPAPRCVWWVNISNHNPVTCWWSWCWSFHCSTTTQLHHY